MKRYGFIYNPTARGNKTDAKFQQLSRLVEPLSGSGIFYSESREHVSELVNQIYEDFDVIVACGGDGTVREVASELIKTEKTLGIIPLGTGNDLSKTLRIPKTLTSAMNLLLQGNISKMDVGLCNDFIFLNTLGFGFDGLTNNYVTKMLRTPSMFRYALAALRSSINHEPFKVQIKKKGGHPREQEIIMITLANGRVEGGSFWIAPQASATDGKLDLITIRPISRWLIPLLLPLFLIKKGEWIPHVTLEKVQNVKLIFEKEIPFHADGEVIKSSTNYFHISLHTRKLPVICGL
ncbi:MAG TPA: diacylglycerol kinase family protein [Balneolaceae bacterium]|nr:diacylglycerol kinase family protein [Balneolaceae bacterium]